MGDSWAVVGQMATMIWVEQYGKDLLPERDTVFSRKRLKGPFYGGEGRAGCMQHLVSNVSAIFATDLR